MPERYEYKVVEVREKMVGGKMSGGKLAKLLNDHASELAAPGRLPVRGCEGSEWTGVPRASLSPSSAASGRATSSPEQIAVDVGSSTIGGHRIVPL